MSTADGSIRINVELDDKNSQKRLSKLNGEIDKTSAKVDQLGAKKAPLVQQAQELEVKMKQARAEVEKYNREWLDGVVGADQKWSGAVSQANQLEQEYRQIVAQIDKIDAEMLPADAALKAAKIEAGKLEQHLAKAPADVKAMGAAYKKAGKSANKFATRLKSILASALVFTVISHALSSFRDWMGKVIKTNDEATQAIGRLKGSLLTLVQPLVNVVIPAFNALVNILSRIVGVIAAVFSGLFGSTAKESAAAAEALYKETEALEGAGSAAEKAGKSLASFDEINKLSSPNTSGGGSASQKIEPIFEAGNMSAVMDSVIQKANDVVENIKTIFRGLKDFFSGLFTGDWGKMFDGLGLAAVGARDLVVNALSVLESFVSSLIDRIIEKFNLSGTWFGNVLEGYKQAFRGLVDFIIGILNGDLAQALSGIEGYFDGLKNVVETVFNEIVSFLPAPLANIVTLVKDMFVNALNGMKEFFTGLTQFLTGVFTKDWELASNGLGNIVISMLNTIIGAIESVFAFIARAINSLIDTVNAVIAQINGILGTGWTGISWRAQEPNWGRIPLLAQGAVIPPNREFLAVLGDQTSGNNIETPEALLRKIVREESANGGSEQPIYLQIDGETFGKFVYKYNRAEARRVGVRLTSV